MKVVINVCFGGFGLSDKAFELWLKLKGIKWVEKRCDTYYTIPIEEYEKKSAESLKKHGDYRDINDKGYVLIDYDIPRDDPDLIKIVEELKDEANGFCAQLKVVEIPDGIEWEIDEYDGNETVEEKHRTWR